MEIIKLQAAFSDYRGQIIDIIEGGEINAVTFITFKKNAVRGNHCHKETTQWNYVVSGRIMIRTRKSGEDVVDTVLTKGDLLVTTPNERHALVALDDSELLVFTQGPRGGKEYETDTFREEIPLIDPLTWKRE